MNAGNGCGAPEIIVVVPDIPAAGLVEVALRAESPTSAAEGLIDVELEGLGRVADVDIKVEIVDEVADAVTAAERAPIKLVGIRLGAAEQAEARGGAVERGGRLILGEGGIGDAESGGAGKFWIPLTPGDCEVTLTCVVVVAM